MGIKIKDIAKKAGVSTTAVSFALNNKEGISEDTRKKILDIVNECGYMPRTLVKYENLEKLQHTNTDTSKLILLLNCPSSPFTKVDSGNVSLAFYEIIKAVERNVNKNNFDLIFKSIDMDNEFQNEVRKIIESYAVAGIIVASTAIPSRFIQQVQDLGIPVVVIDSYYRDVNVECVVMDNYSGAYIAGEYLIGLGHRKIGYLKSIARIHNFDERQAGFEAAMEEHGLKLEEKYIYQVGSTIEDCGAKLQKMVQEGEDFPTAFFAENDYLAIGAMKSFQAMGLKIPEDISIIGFDNLDLSTFVMPELTTISVPWEDMAAISVERLMEKMKDPSSRNLKTRVEVQLVERDSCKQYKSE